MKERPILFSAPMVRAILAGSKTQTRRVMKPQPHYDANYRNWAYGKVGAIVASDARGYDAQGFTVAKMCPYGEVGDRLWVRETWGRYPVAGDFHIAYRADCDDDRGAPWRPSIHMPRAYSRITLEIAGIRAERVQDISEADAAAEGIDRAECSYAYAVTIGAFADLWDIINAPRGYGWDVNPWVWRIEFLRI